MAKKLTAEQIVEVLRISTGKEWEVSPTGGSHDCLELEIWDPYDNSVFPRVLGFVRIVEPEGADIPETLTEHVSVTVHRNGNPFAGGSWVFRDMSAAINFLTDNNYMEA